MKKKALPSGGDQLDSELVEVLARAQLLEHENARLKVDNETLKKNQVVYEAARKKALAINAHLVTAIGLIYGRIDPTASVQAIEAAGLPTT